MTILYGTGGAAGAYARVTGERAHVYDRMRTMLAEWRRDHGPFLAPADRLKPAIRIREVDGVRYPVPPGPTRWLVSADVDVLIRTTFTETPALGPVVVYDLPVGVDSMLPSRSIMLEDELEDAPMR